MHQLVQAFPDIKEHVSITKLTTLKIGGTARFFYEWKDVHALGPILLMAKKLRIPYFILGSGSCVLFTSKEFPGLVVHNKTSHVTIEGTTIRATSGTPLNLVIQKAFREGLTGLEEFTGLPGTVGGAIAGNVGIPAKEMKDVVGEVTFLDHLMTEHTIPVKKCGFSYRNSRFRKRKELVLEATFELKKEDPKVILEKMNEHRKMRNIKHPHDPSAGSYFKNPSKDKPAGLLIDQLGMKGYCIGDACVSEKHANFLINKGNATSTEMRKLAKLIKKRVKKRFGIQLHEEVLYIDANPLFVKMAQNPATRYILAGGLCILGLSGIILPILPGWIFIFMAIEVVAPLKGWEIIRFLSQKVKVEQYSQFIPWYKQK